MKKSLNKALNKYGAFHGKQPKKVSYIEFHKPETLVYLGEVTAIEYKSNKSSGGGDGRMHIYRHTFREKTGLYMDEKGKVQLYLIGKKLKVSYAGIEN